MGVSRIPARSLAALQDMRLPVKHAVAPMSNILHYRGDVTESLMSRTDPLGPDLYGALYRVVSVEYDRDTDTTTAHLRSFVPPGAKPVRYYGGRNNPPPPEYDEDEAK